MTCGQSKNSIIRRRLNVSAEIKKVDNLEASSEAFDADFSTLTMFSDKIGSINSMAEVVKPFK